MPKKVIFWGATGHAMVLRELMRCHDYDLIAVFDNNPSVPPPFQDVPLYYRAEGFNKWKATVDLREVECLVAIGGERGRDRLEIQEFLEKEGLRPSIAVHPTAFVAGNVALSKGCQVLPKAMISVAVTIGDACILNAACSVNHGCALGKGVHIGPGVVLSGEITVGDFTFIGSGAVVLPRIKIGTDVVVGAGAVVTRHVPNGVVTFGNPAKVGRAHSV